jgi:hypothetical protein
MTVFFSAKTVFLIVICKQRVNISEPNIIEHLFLMKFSLIINTLAQNFSFPFWNFVTELINDQQKNTMQISGINFEYWMLSEKNSILEVEFKI